MNVLQMWLLSFHLSTYPGEQVNIQMAGFDMTETSRYSFPLLVTNSPSTSSHFQERLAQSVQRDDEEEVVMLREELEKSRYLCSDV